MTPNTDYRALYERKIMSRQYKTPAYLSLTAMFTAYRTDAELQDAISRGRIESLIARACSDTGNTMDTVVDALRKNLASKLCHLRQGTGTSNLKEEIAMCATLKALYAKLSGGAGTYRTSASRMAGKALYDFNIEDIKVVRDDLSTLKAIYNNMAQVAAERIENKAFNDAYQYVSQLISAKNKLIVVPEAATSPSREVKVAERASQLQECAEKYTLAKLAHAYLACEVIVGEKVYGETTLLLPAWDGESEGFVETINPWTREEGPSLPAMVSFDLSAIEDEGIKAALASIAAKLGITG